MQGCNDRRTLKAVGANAATVPKAGALGLREVMRANNIGVTGPGHP